MESGHGVLSHGVYTNHASHRLLQILNFDWLLNHELFVIVHGWQNENKKMAENLCFSSFCAEFRKKRNIPRAKKTTK